MGNKVCLSNIKGKVRKISGRRFLSLFLAVLLLVGLLPISAFAVWDGQGDSSGGSSGGQTTGGYWLANGDIKDLIGYFSI